MDESISKITWQGTYCGEFMLLLVVVDNGDDVNDDDNDGWFVVMNLSMINMIMMSMMKIKI